MIEDIRKTVAKGLSQYCDCPVVRSNQNAKPPEYPFLSYTIKKTQVCNGTYGEYNDGKLRKPVTQTWCFSAVSDDKLTSRTIAQKAHQWLENVGRAYLGDNDVILQSVGSIDNQDSFLKTEYEYKSSFEAVFSLFDIITVNPRDDSWIETAEINEIVLGGESYEEMLIRLQNRLEGDS